MRTKLALYLALACLASPPAHAALSIDTGNTSQATSSTATLTLTENNTNELIVLYAVQVGSTSFLSSVTDNCGKNWIRRKYISWGGGPNEIEEWYTISTGVYNCTITATYPGSTNWRLLGFGVSGANLTTPWDTNASIPSVNTTTSATTLAPATGYSTTAANTMQLSLFRAVGSAGNDYQPDRLHNGLFRRQRRAGGLPSCLQRPIGS